MIKRVKSIFGVSNLVMFDWVLLTAAIVGTVIVVTTTS